MSDDSALPEELREPQCLKYWGQQPGAHCSLAPSPLGLALPPGYQGLVVVPLMLDKASTLKNVTKGRNQYTNRGRFC